MYLGVSQSLTGRRWVGPSLEVERQGETIAQITGLSPVVSMVLARLGVGADNAPAYLDPTLRDLIPNPRGIKDLETAARFITQAILQKSRVAIFADYDVDGGASAALLAHYMRALGTTPTLYVPDRIDEGYGPNAPAIQNLAAHHDLIICVDCGTLSHDALRLREARLSWS